MSLADNIIAAESSGDANAKNPNSSALGPSQFIDSTWLSTIKTHRPDLAQGRSDDEILAMRTNPQISREMTDAYAGDNAAILAKAGLPVTDGTKYLAHFAGPGGAVKVLQADPNAPATDILGPAAAKANPFLAGMTVQGLQAWAAKKAGVTLPAGAPGAAPVAQPAQPAAPPPQPPPQFAQAAPAPRPMAQASPDPGLQAPPIQFARPHQVDLSGLRAALQRQAAPIFARTA